MYVFNGKKEKSSESKYIEQKKVAILVGK